MIATLPADCTCDSTAATVEPTGAVWPVTAMSRPALTVRPDRAPVPVAWTTPVSATSRPASTVTRAPLTAASAKLP